MSSLWSSIRGRKTSKSVEESERTKPPSGRSSSKNSRMSTNEDLQRQDSDEKTKKGCLAVSCLSGQGFPCKSLSAKLLKVQKSGSTTRKSSNTGESPIAPLPTPEPDSMTFPDLSNRPPIPDSPKPKIKLFRKRAASASPSRMQAEKRKMFRGLSKERLIAPLPASIKNLILHRKSQSKPDISLAAKNPIRPLRKPGPLGRSWVKVYNDITYVDDVSEDNYPILGHSGYPVKLPEAVPLPKSPTPPPQKVKVYDIVLEDIKPQKDALIKEKILLNITKDTEDLPFNHKTENQQKSTLQTDNDNIEGKVLKQDNLITKSLTADVPNIDIENEADSPAKNASLKIERPSRNREAIRHKAKRSKRSGTPIAVEGLLPSPEEVAAAQRNDSNITDNISYEEVMEDGYIIPQSLNPPKPPRANKAFDEINGSDNEVAIIETTSLEALVSENTTDDRNVKHFEDQMSFPDRPKRGNKSYDNIINKQNLKSSSVVKSSTDVAVVEKVLPIEHKTINYNGNDDFHAIVEPPPKPKRKPKIYENIHNCLNSDVHSIVLHENVDIVNTTTEIETPSKPFRGHKNYNKSTLNKEMKLNDNKCKERSKIMSKVNMRNDNSNINNSDDKENVFVNIDAAKKSPYATVRKDRLSKELREISPLKDITDCPPPIPPKKKDIKAVENSFSQLISPSAQSLVVKTRSAETSPCRPRRRRLIAQINRDNSPSGSNTSTKVYTELQLIHNSNMTRDTLSNYGPKTNRSEPVKCPYSSREFRQSCPLPPPPRPIKSPASQRKKEHSFQKQDQDIDRNIPPIESLECTPDKLYNPLIKSSSTRRNRPPPPPPPNLKGKSHDTQIVRNDVMYNQEQICDPIESLPVVDPNLNTDIDMNLKNIEHSFQTLDSVLNSLQSYATPIPAWSHEKTKRRLSCDVVCDETAEFLHSINQNNNIQTEVSNVTLTHNTVSDTHNQFVGLISSEKVIKGVEESIELKDQLTGSKTDNKEAKDFSSTKGEFNMESPQRVEFKVSVPSIVPLDIENIPLVGDKLACQLNIEPIKSDIESQTEYIEHAAIAANTPATSTESSNERSDTKEAKEKQKMDPHSGILEHCEDEIKAISRDLNTLRSTLERCDSDYSGEALKEMEKVVVGTLLLGGSITDLECAICSDNSESSEENKTNVVSVDKSVPSDEKLTKHINEHIESVSNQLETSSKTDKPIQHEIQPSYSFQKHLTGVEHLSIVVPKDKTLLLDEKLTKTINENSDSVCNKLEIRSETDKPVQQEIKPSYSFQEHLTEVEHLTDVVSNEKTLLSDENLTKTINENNDSVRNKIEMSSETDKPIQQEIKPSYSFQEHLNKSPLASKPSNHYDISIPDAAGAMERLLEGVTINIRGSNKQDILCEKIQENPIPANEKGSIIFDTSFKDSDKISSTIDTSSTKGIQDADIIGTESNPPYCHITNNDISKYEEINEDDSSEEVSEASSCTVEELKLRSVIKKELHPDQNLMESVTKEEQSSNNVDIITVTALEEHLKELDSVSEINNDSKILQAEPIPTTGDDADSQNLLEQPDTSELLHGVADITGKLEGIRSQLEAVISNYIPSIGLSDSSLDYTSSESTSASMSNRSSLSVDQSDSSSNASFYSLSQPSLSNYSLLSYYTARSAASPALSESPINTPSVGSRNSDCDDLTEPEMDDHC